MFRDPMLYLDDIVEAVEVIQEYSANMTFESFAADVCRRHMKRLP